MPSSSIGFCVAMTKNGSGQLVRRLVDGDLALLHRLEEARLRARRRAVDLIDQDDVREHRTGTELELLSPLVVDRDAGDVGRHEVRRALDAVERQRERPRDRARERGLPHAGHVVEQHVAFDEQRGEELLSRALLADHHARDLIDEPRGRVANCFHG